MSIIEELAADALARIEGDPALLRELVERLDQELAAGPLERTVRLWDVSVAEIGRMFGVSRQAAAKWLADGPPPARRDQVTALGQATDLLDQWVKRERIPAVVRRPLDRYDGHSLLDLALAGRFDAVRDELVETFDLTRIAP